MRERWSEMRMQGCEESLDNSWQLGQCKIGSSGYRWKKSLYDNREISEASKIQVFFHHEWNAFLLPCAIVSSLLCPATLLSPEAGRVPCQTSVLHQLAHVHAPSLVLCGAAQGKYYPAPTQPQERKTAEEAQSWPGQGGGCRHPGRLVKAIRSCWCPQDPGTNNPSCTRTRSRSLVRKQGSVITSLLLLLILEKDLKPFPLLRFRNDLLGYLK